MSAGKGKYNIKAVSTMLGIQPGTLRAWERRYSIIDPVRNEVGHRLYTEEHISVLKWLMNKINKGFTIGQAVGLLERDEIIERVQEDQPSHNYIETLRKDLLGALLSFNEYESNQFLDRAFSIFTVEKVVVDILGDILVNVEDMLKSKQITTAHEHFVSSYIRTKIGNILHSLSVEGILPKVVCVCAPNEQNELGLLMFTLFLKRKGFETVFLGGGIPKEDLFIVLKEIEPKYLFLSCTVEENLSGAFRVANEIQKYFNDEIKVGIGGDSTERLSKSTRMKYQGLLVGNSVEEWFSWLKNHV